MRSMISRCAADNCVRQSARMELRCFFCIETSGLSAGSSMNSATSSSSSSVDRRRSAESALLRAIASNQVETLGSGLKAIGLAPTVQKHLAHQVLGCRFVIEEAQHKAIDAHIVA